MIHAIPDQRQTLRQEKFQKGQTLFKAGKRLTLNGVRGDYR